MARFKIWTITNTGSSGFIPRRQQIVIDLQCRPRIQFFQKVGVPGFMVVMRLREGAGRGGRRPRNRGGGQDRRRGRRVVVGPGPGPRGPVVADREGVILSARSAGGGELPRRSRAWSAHHSWAISRQEACLGV